jgi:hypothetical protein
MSITQENLKELIGEQEVSEDTLLKIKIMVENSINEKVEAAIEETKTSVTEELQPMIDSLTEQVAAMETSHAEELASISESANAYAEYVVQEMTAKIDTYAEYVVEKFIADNKAALVEADEYARMKETFSKIKAVFEEQYFDLVPTDRTSELEQEIAAVKEDYESVFAELQTANEDLDEMRHAIVFESLTRGLAETQKEKVKALVENVSFDSIGEFKKGVELMVNQVTESKTADSSDEVKTPLSEESKFVSAEVKASPAGDMARYLKVL